MMDAKICPMCSQGMAFNESLNNQLTGSVIITKKQDTGMHFMNFFVSTKDKKPQNVGGAAFAIKYCPWCGRSLNEE